MLHDGPGQKGSPNGRMKAGSTVRVRRSSWGTGHEPQEAHSERDLFEAETNEYRRLHRRSSSGTGQVPPARQEYYHLRSYLYWTRPGRHPSTSVESRGMRRANLPLSRQRVHLLNASAPPSTGKSSPRGFAEWTVVASASAPQLIFEVGAVQGVRLVDQSAKASRARSVLRNLRAHGDLARQMGRTVIAVAGRRWRTITAHDSVGDQGLASCVSDTAQCTSGGDRKTRCGPFLGVACHG